MPQGHAGVAPVRPSVLDDRALFGHPRGLGLLFVVEMWERFSYYGMRAFLILYLVDALGWSNRRAAGLYGVYTSAVYLTPLAGGYLADRLIGTRRSVVLGGVIIALGHFCLAIPSTATFTLGLGLIIAGTGFFKPNAATMVGQIYRPGDPRRDSGFTVYYMGVNAGALAGPIICGLLAEKVGWRWGFGAAGVGMLAGLVVYLIWRDVYLPGIGVKAEGGAEPSAAGPRPEEDRAVLGRGVAGAVAGAGLALLVAGPEAYPILLGAGIGAVVAITVMGTHGEERRRVLAIYLAAAFVVFFWTAYEQAGSSMNLFADRNTDRVTMGYEWPASWFQSLNPLLIVLVLAPAFTALWGWLGARRAEPSTPVKMVIGLTLLGVGFMFLVAGGRRADSGALVSPMWLAMAYLFHTLGELCVAPVGLSYASRLAPARYSSLLMAAWSLANAVANLLAGSLAGLTPTPGREPTLAAGGGLAGWLQRASATNAGFFSIFVAIGVAGAALMLLVVPVLKRLTASVDGGEAA